MKKILAVASGGGHWKQLMLLKPAFDGYDITYITTIDGLPQQAGLSNYVLVKDSNKDRKLDLLVTVFQILIQLLRIRPDYIISTGAAPGIFSIVIGRALGAKTLWVDSIANGDQLSLGGRIARSVSTEVLTQWEELEDEVVKYRGAVY